MLDIRLLGPLEVDADGRRVALVGGRERALLALLVVNRDRTVVADEIIESLWRDEPLRDPRHSLQASVARLRRMLRDAGGHDAAVVTQDPGYRFETEAIAVLDLDRFERHVADAGRLVDVDLVAASKALADGLALFRGDPLADFTYEEWAQGEISRLAEERLTASGDRIDMDLRLGRHGRVVGELEVLVREHPYHERFRALLMLALYRSGRQEAALAAYRDARQLLDDELGIDPGRELQELERAILRQDPDISLEPGTEGADARAAPGRSVAVAPSGNLPVQLTSFIGRDSDISELSGLLVQQRLVTLVGAGGTGKTRLAIETAQRLRSGFPHGSWFVDLSATRTGGDAERAIGAVLDVHENYEMTLDQQIVEHVRERRLLLILDNCEQAADAIAPLVEAALLAAPHLTVLATSREPLNIAGEALWPVEALPVPTLAEGEGAAEKSDSYRLFVERARLANPRFDLDEATTTDVISICRSTDGIPLAIELAAGQLVGMTVSDIAARLRARPIALGRTKRAGDSRQQTFEATVDRSYGLLETDEQALFRRLAIFEGGFSTSAAEATAFAQDDDQDVAELLVDLVRKSTLTQGAAPGSSSRYRMLEPIRQFALERLRENSEDKAAMDRHLAFFGDLSTDAALGLRSADQSRWLRVVDLEYGNLVAALRWAQEQSAWDDAARIGTALGPYWRVRGYLSEGRALAESVLDHAEVDPALRATMLSDVGMLAFFQCEYQETQGLSRQALEILDGEADGSVAAYALLVDGLASWKLEGHQRAAEILARSLDAYQEAGDGWGAGTALAYSGMVLMDEGDLDAAAELHEQSLGRFREQGDEWGTAFSLSALGSMSLAQGELEEAEASLSEALALSERMQDRWGTARARMYLARIALARGDKAAARAGLDAAMEGYRRLHDREDAAMCLGGYAALVLEEDAPQDAAMLLGAADTLGRSVATTFASGSLESLGDSDLRKDLADRLGEEEFEQRLRRGSRLSWDDALTMIARGPSTVAPTGSLTERNAH